MLNIPTKPMPDYTFEKEWITPEIAQKMLEDSKNLGFTNRNVSKKYFGKFTYSMEHDDWDNNVPAPIIVDKTGCVIDGQHRLLSIINSNKPDWFLVVRNANSDIIWKVDQGKPRTDADIFTIEKLTEDGSDFGRAARMLLYITEYNNYNDFVDRKRCNSLYTMPKLFETARRNGGIINEAISAVKSIKGQKKFVTTHMYVLYTCVHLCGYKVELFDDFLYKIITGENLKKGDPELAYRAFTDTWDKFPPRHLPQIKCSTLFLTWNKRAKGQQMLRIPPQNQHGKFLPKIIGYGYQYDEEDEE